MRFLIDETCTAVIAVRLRMLGHDATSIIDLGLNGQDDRTIFEAARGLRAALVTCDPDFARVTRYPPVEVGGIVYIRSGNMRRDDQAALVEKFVASQAIGDLPGALVTLYADGTVRIMKP